MQPIDTTTRRLLANPKKRRAWVIYQLLLKGKTLADVARNAGVQRQTLYHVFDRAYPRMEAVLASALSMQPQQLFSERYCSDGLPTRRKGIGNGKRKTPNGPSPSFHGGKDTPKRVNRNTQARRAA